MFLFVFLVSIKLVKVIHTRRRTSASSAKRVQTVNWGSFTEPNRAVISGSSESRARKTPDSLRTPPVSLHYKWPHSYHTELTVFPLPLTSSLLCLRLWKYIALIRDAAWKRHILCMYKIITVLEMSARESDPTMVIPKRVLRVLSCLR